MQTELYSDGIGEITVNGSIVRVDLVSLSATERDAGNNPKSVFRQRIIFSVEAFANSVEIMQQALRGSSRPGLNSDPAGTGEHHADRVRYWQTCSPDGTRHTPPRRMPRRTSRERREDFACVGSRRPIRYSQYRDLPRVLVLPNAL